MEYKRDAHTGEFFMIEPTVGRVDWQEEVAALTSMMERHPPPLCPTLCFTLS